MSQATCGACSEDMEPDINCETIGRCTNMYCKEFNKPYRIKQ